MQQEVGVRYSPRGPKGSTQTLKHHATFSGKQLWTTAEQHLRLISYCWDCSGFRRNATKERTTVTDASSSPDVCLAHVLGYLFFVPVSTTVVIWRLFHGSVFLTNLSVMAGVPPVHVLAADFSLAAAEPVDQPAADTMDDQPADFDVVSSEETSAMEESATIAATDVAVSAKAPIFEPGGVDELMAPVPVVVEDDSADVDPMPIVNGTVEVDGDTPPSYAEVVGEVKEGTPDANVVDEVTVDRALPADLQDQPSAFVAEVESMSEIPVVMESEELVPTTAAQVGFAAIQAPALHT